MAKAQAKSKQKRSTAKNESDGAYLLKIVLYIILGALWLRFPDPIAVGPLLLKGFPVGLFIGLLFASHDHFQMDRKIEYVVLILATIISLFLPTGIMI